MTTTARTSRRGRGIKAVALAGLLATAGAGTAYAYWTGTGSGSGSATAGTMQAVTIDVLVAGDNPKTALIPGGSADVVLRLTNPNPYPVQVYNVTANGPAAADAAHPGCATTGVSFRAPAAPLSPATYVAANSTALITLPGAAAMDTTSLPACQGASFSLPVTTEVRK